MTQKARVRVTAIILVCRNGHVRLEGTYGTGIIKDQKIGTVCAITGEGGYKLSIIDISHKLQIRPGGRVDETLGKIVAN